MDKILADDANGELVHMASINPEVLALEKFMMALGLQVIFANKEDLGKIVVTIFDKMKKLGKCFPSSIWATTVIPCSGYPMVPNFLRMQFD
jgi:hypothetical protein